MSELDDLEEIAELIEHPLSEKSMRSTRFRKSARTYIASIYDGTHRRPKWQQQLSAIKGAADARKK